MRLATSAAAFAIGLTLVVLVGLAKRRRGDGIIIDLVILALLMASVIVWFQWQGRDLLTRWLK